MFSDILYTKKPFFTLKYLDFLKGEKFTFLAKKLVHDFGQKFEVSSPWNFSFKLIKKCIWCHSWYKKLFLDYKNVDIWKLKNFHSLQRGQSMILVKNLKFPHLVCSGCNWSKRTFGDILDTKKLSRLQKRWYLKGWKFEFFAKGLVHDFGHKFEVSSPSLLSFKLIKKSVRRHSWYKNPFLHYKNVDIIKLKNLHSLSSGYSIILVGNLKILWLDFSWPIWPQGPEEMC